MAKFNGFKEEYEGLKQNKVKELQKVHGFNELTPPKKENIILKILKALTEPMFLLLIITATIYFILGEPKDGLIMLVSIAFMLGINTFQEWRTDKTLNALKELSAPKVKIIRDNKLIEVESREVVVSDLMIIYEGDKISADGIVLEHFDLGVDESTLTGESDIVWKKTSLNNDEHNNKWLINHCYAGTSVTGGSAILKVTAIGPNTEYGKIGTALVSVTNDKTPLEKQINRLIITFASIGLLASTLVIAITYINQNTLEFGDRITKSILAGVTLAMGLIPEEFPVILTVFLAMGVWRLAKKNSLIRKMPSVETLGAVTVLCVDKTGTLTKNKMTVQEVYNYKDNNDLLEYSALACETEPYDPMEKAILKYAFENGVKNDVFDKELHSEYSFSSVTKMMGHMWYINSEICLAAKGSPESILPLCHLTKDNYEMVNEVQKRMSMLGYRVIAVARRINIKTVKEKLTDNDLELLGLIGLIDPHREAVPSAIQTCYKAGIKVVMITGDNILTAKTIAKNIGILNYENALTGTDVDNLSDYELKEVVKTTNIFARVIPQHKMRIVKSFKENGEVVAMTGDGVNDAPALKYADIGIAMGKRGTNVAKEASDMVLLDDDFSTIVDTVKDGRRIYDNIKKAVSYILIIHIPIALIAMLTPALGLPIMLMPVHIVLFELIIDPTCSIVFERQKAEKNIMDRKPRLHSASLITKRLIIKSVFQGLMVFCATFGTYLYLLNGNVDENLARTMALTILFTSNFFMVYVNHSETEFAYRGFSLIKDKVILFVNLGIVVALTIVLYTPFGNSIAKTTPLNIQELVVAILVAAAFTFWYEVVKAIKKVIHAHKSLNIAD